MKIFITVKSTRFYLCVCNINVSYHTGKIIDFLVAILRARLCVFIKYDISGTQEKKKIWQKIKLCEISLNNIKFSNLTTVTFNARNR